MGPWIPDCLPCQFLQLHDMLNCAASKEPSDGTDHQVMKMKCSISGHYWREAAANCLSRFGMMHAGVSTILCGASRKPAEKRDRGFEFALLSTH
jgi:hypothetical protein